MKGTRIATGVLLLFKNTKQLKSYSRIPHKFLQLLLLSFCEWWCWFFVVIILKQHREYILDGLAFGVAHCVNAGIYHLGKQLVGEGAALAVATDDATDLPECEVIEESVVVDSNFAHEQLVDVVGGYEFFAFFPPLLGLSFGSPSGML